MTISVTRICTASKFHLGTKQHSEASTKNWRVVQTLPCQREATWHCHENKGLVTDEFKAVAFVGPITGKRFFVAEILCSSFFFFFFF